VYADRNLIQLAIGHGTDAAKAFKIEVRGLDLSKDTYFRGEVVERIVGRVWKRRNELLIHAARALEPDFDIETDKIHVGENKLPNPVIAYEELLDHYINGSLSKIHGDLHLGNIIVGPNNSASLIDFAHTRDGHTLFDWATLEVSLLSDLVAPVAGEGWDGARLALRYMDALNTHRTLPADHPELTTSFAAVTSLRRIVGECLATENVWSEYFIALALCALRAIMWETMPVGSRRLMLLIAAQSIGELRNHPQAMLSQEVTSPDDTDHSNPASDQ
jgi:hypothetical protein